MPDDALGGRIRVDINRLTRVGHQLLEMQALGAVELPAEPRDLNLLVEGIATDLAPLAMDAGYEFEPSVGAAMFTVQASIIEMACSALSWLLHNLHLDPANDLSPIVNFE